MKKNVKKVILTVLSVALIVALSVTATLAWLQDTTEPVVNTFTEGKVDIDLYETKDGEKVMANSYKMVPGDVLAKDPAVEVLAVSEACWLFVKVEEINDVDSFLDYDIAEGWTLVPGETNVYYRAVADTDDVQKFYVLAGDNNNPNGIVTVNSDVEMSDMNGLTEANRPQLKFTAYAIQSANIKDINNNGAADEAWAALNP